VCPFYHPFTDLLLPNEDLTAQEIEIRKRQVIQMLREGIMRSRNPRSVMTSIDSHTQKFLDLCRSRAEQRAEAAGKSTEEVTLVGILAKEVPNSALTDIKCRYGNICNNLRWNGWCKYYHPAQDIKAPQDLDESDQQKFYHHIAHILAKCRHLCRMYVSYDVIRQYGCEILELQLTREEVFNRDSNFYRDKYIDLGAIIKQSFPDELARIIRSYCCVSGPSKYSGNSADMDRAYYGLNMSFGPWPYHFSSHKHHDPQKWWDDHGHYNNSCCYCHTTLLDTGPRYFLHRNKINKRLIMDFHPQCLIKFGLQHANHVLDDKLLRGYIRGDIITLNDSADANGFSLFYD
jgi:hypothetical protein